MTGRPPLAAMAWRNLWRHRRRTSITLSSIAFGTFFAFMVTGFQDAQWAEMIDVAARLSGGHVTLQHPEYLESPTLSRTVAQGELVQVARRDPEVRRVVTRITGQLMLSTAEESYGAAFIAFDPASEDLSTLSILEALSEGQLFESNGGQEIILGQRLAENLNARIGRKIVFTLTDKRGDIVRDVGRVSGFLSTGSPTVDAALVLLPLDRMREVLGYEGDEVSQVAVFIDDQRAAEQVSARLGAAVVDAAALPWYEISPDLAGFITMKVVGAWFMEIIILLLVAAGIFNTIFVSVMERTREFGIMIAVGFSPGSIFRLVMYESLWLGLCGLVLAAIVTAWPYYYLATVGVDVMSALGMSGVEVAGIGMSGRMYAWIYFDHAVVIVLAALGATLLAGVSPAFHAGRVEPVESIRLV